MAAPDDTCPVVVETIHAELRDALCDAFESAYRQSLYGEDIPVFWGIDYGNGCAWFLYVTSNRRLWADA